MIKKMLIVFMMVFQISDAMADININSILQEYYPINYQGCNGVLVEDVGYCVQIDNQRTVDTQYGKRHYVLVSGDVKFDKNGDDLDGMHVFLGLVGMFVLKEDDNGWKVESANPTMYAGSYGTGLTDWTLHKFASNTWGFLNQHGDVHQGVSGAHFVILTPDGKGAITESWISSSFDDVHSGICGVNGCSDINAAIKIDRSLKINNFYPLNLTLNGVINGEKYRNRVYRIEYKNSTDGYTMPNNYPLMDIEY